MAARSSEPRPEPGARNRAGRRDRRNRTPPRAASVFVGNAHYLLRARYSDMDVAAPPLHLHDVLRRFHSLAAPTRRNRSPAACAIHATTAALRPRDEIGRAAAGSIPPARP